MPKRSPLALVIELAVKSRDAIARRSDELSSVYQASKDDNDIPLS